MLQAAKAGRDAPVDHGRATAVDLAAYEADAADPLLWQSVAAEVPGSDLASSEAQRCAQLLVRYQALADQPPDRLARLLQGRGPDVRYEAIP